jgi:hypothetical protein
MTVQFDTGSSLVYLLTDDCKDCPKGFDAFHTKESSTFETTGKHITNSYGSGEVEGDLARESICLTKTADSCIDKVSFIAVDHATDIEKDRFSGIIGLSPT